MNSVKQPEKAAVAGRQIKSKPVFGKTVMIDIDIAYPQVTVPQNVKSSAEISGFYRDSAIKYYACATHGLYEDAVKEYRNSLKGRVPFRTYSARAVFEVPFSDGRFLSIYTDTFEYAGSAHGNTVRRAETWNIAGGKRVGLFELFPDPSCGPRVIREIFSRIESQIAKGNNTYFEDYRKNVFRCFDESRFYLTPEGVAVYFPLSTIAPDSSGIVPFVIPFPLCGDSPPRGRSWVSGRTPPDIPPDTGRSG